jgi:hypothetical protein
MYPCPAQHVSRKDAAMRRRLILKTFSTILFSLGVLTVTPGYVAAQEALAQARPMIRRPLARNALKGSLSFARTELFFGTAKPDGVVTDDEFLAFLDEQITPRFPDGLTVLRADGQFSSDGEVIKEKSFLLILLYPVEDFRKSSRNIEAIRTLYKDAFAQESVLRVDDPIAVRVSF